MGDKNQEISSGITSPTHNAAEGKMEKMEKRDISLQRHCQWRKIAETFLTD